MRGTVVFVLVGLVAAGGCGNPTGVDLVSGTYSIVASDSLGTVTFEGVLTLRFSGHGVITGGWDIRRVVGPPADYPADLNGHGEVNGTGFPGARQHITLDLTTDSVGVARELEGRWGTYVGGFSGDWRVFAPEAAGGGSFTAIRISNDELKLAMD